MAVSNILTIVLLGLFGAALAVPAVTPAANTTTTAAATTTGSGGNGTTPAAGGLQDCLTEAEKTKICEVKPGAGNSTNSTSAPPALCAAAGPTDDFCSKLAASVNGTSPSCVAVNVCSFKVANATTGNSTAGTGSTTAGTGGSTTAGTTTSAGTGTTVAGTGTTVAGNGTTVAGNGTTAAGTGSTTTGTGPAVVPEPNTAYITCNATPAGFQEIKTCPGSKTIFVYPGAANTGTGSTVAANSSDSTTIPTTKNKIF
ncbi:hypothetical protein WDU94_006075 [Cyamophila willieti]